MWFKHQHTHPYTSFPIVIFWIWVSFSQRKYTRLSWNYTKRAKNKQNKNINRINLFLYYSHPIFTNTQTLHYEQEIKEMSKTQVREVLIFLFIFCFVKFELPGRNSHREDCLLRPKRSSKSKVQWNDSTICCKVLFPLLSHNPLVLYPFYFVLIY